MKKLALVLSAILFMGMIFASCDPSSADTQKAAVVCGASVLVTTIVAVAALAGQEEVAAEAESQGIAKGDILQLIPACIDFGYDLLSSAPATPTTQASSTSTPSTPSTPQTRKGSSPTVTLSSKYSLQANFSGKIYTMTLGNCKPTIDLPTLKFQINFSLAIPFNMSVGSKDKFSYFHARPTGNSDLDLVGNAIFGQYHLSGAVDTVKQVARLEIASHKKVTLSLSLTVPYTYGLARLDRGSSTFYIPWAFLNTRQTVQVNLNTQNC
ncbi:MAG TPA: hypothetical protein VGD98_11260 [Ktedonobacteraceae bacterium]